MVNSTSSHSIPITYSKNTYRCSVGILFFALGICFSSWASQIPHIQERLGLSDVQLGFVLFAIPVGRFTSVAFSNKVITYFGSRKLLVYSVIACSVVLIGLGIAEHKFVLMFLLLLFGVCYNFIILSLNTQAVVVERLYERSIMASFHGLWSLACLGGALLATFLIEHGLQTYQHLMLVSVSWVMATLACMKYLPADDTSTSAKRPLFTMPDKFLLLMGLIAFCCMMCESTLFDWSGIYFSKIVKTDKSLIGVGYASVVAAMTVGRFISDWFVTKYGFKLTLQLSGTFITSGLLLVVLFPYLVPATIGFLLAGLGVSSVVPLAYAVAGKAGHVPAPVAIVTVSTIGFTGYLIGPPMIGSIAGASSLRVSFGLVALMGIGIFYLAGRVNKSN